MPPDVSAAMAIVADWCSGQLSPVQLQQGGGLQEWARLNLLSAVEVLQRTHEPGLIRHVPTLAVGVDSAGR